MHQLTTTHCPQVDLSDAEDGCEDNEMGRRGGHGDTAASRRSVVPVYSREDIREQYCINDKELQVLDQSQHRIWSRDAVLTSDWLQVLDSKRRKGLLGCFSDNGAGSGISPCTKHGKRSVASRAGNEGS